MIHEIDDLVCPCNPRSTILDLVPSAEGNTLKISIWFLFCVHVYLSVLPHFTPVALALRCLVILLKVEQHIRLLTIGVALVYHFP